MATKKELITQGGLFMAEAQAINGSLLTGIVAHAGGTQAGTQGDSASWLTAVTNIIATCATGGDSALLPVADQGDEVFVRNNGAASCNVYPQTGGNINNAGANAAFAVTNGKTAHFKSFGGGNWVAMLSA